MNTGVNKVETISARDAVFVAVGSAVILLTVSDRSDILVVEISDRARLVAFHSSLFWCIKSKTFFRHLELPHALRETLMEFYFSS